jgi:hypothetical protein
MDDGLRAMVRDFVQDLRWSVRAWKVDPRLPVAAFVVAAVEIACFAIKPSRDPSQHVASNIAAVAGALVVVWLIGFRGVERVWYDRIGVGWSFSWSEIRKCNADLRSRFFRLGVLVLVPVGLLLTPVDHASAGVRYGVAGAIWFLVDVLLTFVTVQLALVTSSVWEAIVAGLDVLRRTWPSCALYVLVPPLGLQLLFETGAGFGMVSRIAAEIVVIPIALACRGATVRYYDREAREFSVHE